MATLDKYKELANNTAVFAVSSLASKIILFFLVPLYTSQLSAADFGMAEIIITISDLVIPLATLAISNAVFRFAIDKKRNDKEVLACYYFVFFFSVIIIIAVGVVLNYLEAYKGFGLFFVLVAVLTSYQEAYGLYVKAKNHTIVFAASVFIYSAFLGILNILFLSVFHWGIRGYFYAIIGAKSISLLFLFFYGKSTIYISYRNMNYKLLKEMLFYSVPLIFNSIFWWVMNYSDKFMLQVMVGMEAVGLYTVAAKIPSLLNTVINIFIQAWNIAAIKEYEGEKDQRFYNTIFGMMNSVLMLATALILMIVTPFMHIYVTEAYYVSIIYIPSLLMGAFFLAYASYFGTILSSAKQSHIFMTSSFLGAAGNIVMNIVLIPLWGALGAAIATMVSYAVVAFYRMIRSFKYISVDIHYKSLIISLSVLILQGIAVTLKFHSVSVSVIVILFILIVYREYFRKLLSICLDYKKVIR